MEFDLIINLGLTSPLYEGCEIVKKRGSARLMIPVAEAMPILKGNLEKLLEGVENKHSVLITINVRRDFGVMWAHMVAVAAVVSFFDEVWYSDGWIDPVLIS